MKLVKIVSICLLMGVFAGCRSCPTEAKEAPAANIVTPDKSTNGGTTMNAEASARETELHGEPVFIRFMPGPHLFIDDFLISESANLTRTTHQPKKLPEPVIAKGESWQLQPLFYMRVADDGPAGLFRAWYNVKNPGGNPSICYAYAVSTIGNKPVRLEFRLRQAELYALDVI